MRLHRLARKARWIANLPAQPAARGFTLIELLVVIAIMTILFTLIFKPLIDSFNLTSRANTQSESQSAARQSLSDINTLLADSVYVYDNTQTPVRIWLPDANGVQFFLDQRYSMIEYVSPARQLDQQPGGTPLDPTTGLPIYTGLPENNSGYALPLAPGRVLGRIWIGLRDNNSQNGVPVKPYGNKYEDPKVGNGGDNRYTLLRAEAPAFIQDPTFAGPGTAPFIPNLSLFHTTDGTKTGGLLLHDPNFYYDSSLAGDAATAGDVRWAVKGWRDLNGDGKVEINENWHAIATTLLQTDKADMITLDRDPDTNAIIYNAGNQPTVRSLATFAPAYFPNDPAVASSSENSGNETANALPRTYSPQHTHWNVPFKVTVYRTPNPVLDPVAQSPQDYYLMDGVPNAPTSQQPIFHTPVSSTIDVGPGIDPTGSFFQNLNPQIAFSVDSERGVVNWAFPATVYIHDAAGNARAQMYSPVEIDDHGDFNSTVGQWSERYLDLRTLVNSDPADTGGALPPWVGNGAYGQLNSADVGPSPLAPTMNWYPDVRIVTGSEKVFGPDQRPGPHYGFSIQYQRVPSLSGGLQGSVGQNQFRINYQPVQNAINANDPRQQVGCIVFDSDPDGQMYNQADDPKNSVFAPSRLPTSKFDPVSGLNVPADPVLVYYDFQTNRPNDVVKVDYLTRELINVSLEIRYYDPASGRPQTTDVADKVKVRNLQH